MKVFVLLSLVALATSASVKSGSAPASGYSQAYSGSASASAPAYGQAYSGSAPQQQAVAQAAEIALARTSSFASAGNFMQNVASLGSAQPAAVSALYQMVKSSPSVMDVASFVEALPYVSSFSPKLRSVMKNTPTEQIPQLTAAAAALSALPSPAIAKLRSAGQSGINEFINNAKAVASLSAGSIVQLKSAVSDNAANIESAIASNPAIANLKPATVTLLRSVPTGSVSKVVAAAQTVASGANALSPSSISALTTLSGSELNALAESNEAINTLTYGAAKMLKSLDSQTFSVLSDNANAFSKLSPTFLQYLRTAPASEVQALATAAPAVQTANGPAIKSAFKQVVSAATAY